MFYTITELSKKLFVQFLHFYHHIIILCVNLIIFQLYMILIQHIVAGYISIKINKLQFFYIK